MLGFAFSLLIIRFDLAIPFTFNILFIIPASFLCSLIDKRFTCLAYVIPMLYLLNKVFLGVGLEDKWFILPYANFIVLVGVLHMTEGMMTVLYRHQDHEIIIAYKGNSLVGGYHTYKKWFIPLLLFYIKEIYLPIIIVLVYAEDTFMMEPSYKTGIMGSAILLYGIIISLLGYLSIKGHFPVQLAIICMPILHEMLFEISRNMENRKSEMK